MKKFMKKFTTCLNGKIKKTQAKKKGESLLSLKENVAFADDHIVLSLKKDADFYFNDNEEQKVLSRTRDLCVKGEGEHLERQLRH